MTSIGRRSLLIAALMLPLMPAVSAAQTGDVVFPTGSQVGLVPPPGMTPSTNFSGFEDRSNNAGIIMVSLPPDAYAELEKSIGADGLKKQGLAVESREGVTLSTGKGFLVIGRQEIDKVWVRKLILIAGLPTATVLVTAQIPESVKAHYPDGVIRTALQSLTARATVPVEERLALLPFKVNDLAGFQVAGVIPGRAVMLSDVTEQNPAEPPAPGRTVDPHIFVGIAPGGPSQPSERDHFARDVFANVPNLRARITGSESIRISSQQGHQILATGLDPTGAELQIVQWLRFGGGAYLQFVGIARADAWRDAYPRFRSVRDGIEPK